MIIENMYLTDQIIITENQQMEPTETEALKLLCIHVCVDIDRDMCTVRGLQTETDRQTDRQTDRDRERLHICDTAGVVQTLIKNKTLKNKGGGWMARFKFSRFAGVRVWSAYSCHLPRLQHVQGSAGPEAEDQLSDSRTSTWMLNTVTLKPVWYRWCLWYIVLPWTCRSEGKPPSRQTGEQSDPRTWLASRKI